MKVMYMIIVAGLLFMSSCTKDNFVSTGISKGRFDGNMLEYMAAHTYDWDSVRVMIQHAGDDMVELFEGRASGHEAITFFGLTNHSIRRYLLRNEKKQISDLDPEWCKDILLQHVVDGKYYRKEIPEGEPGDYGTAGTGGITLRTLGGTDLWVFAIVQEKDGIVENAARPIFVNFKKSNKEVGVASADIEPDNGLVHALEYDFTLGDEE